MAEGETRDVAHEIQERIRALGEELNRHHRELHETSLRVDSLEREAGEHHFDRVVASLRDVYTNIAEAGRALVEAHLNLNVPPGAWKTETPPAEPVPEPPA